MRTSDHAIPPKSAIPSKDMNTQSHAAVSWVKGRRLRRASDSVIPAPVSAWTSASKGSLPPSGIPPRRTKNASP